MRGERDGEEVGGPTSYRSQWVQGVFGVWVLEGFSWKSRCWPKNGILNIEIVEVVQ